LKDALADTIDLAYEDEKTFPAQITLSLISKSRNAIVTLLSTKRNLSEGKLALSHQP
jgi:hypothetical protein